MGVKRITNGCSEAATLTVLREPHVRQGKIYGSNQSLSETRVCKSKGRGVIRGVL